jgi:hypothetical protein
MEIVELFTSPVFLITFFGGLGVTLVLAFITRRLPTGDTTPVYNETANKLARDVDKLRFNSDMQYIRGLQDGYSHARNSNNHYVINDNNYNVDDKISRR